MGTTLSSLHVYSPDAVCEFSDFHTFSEGWQTYLPSEEPEDPFITQKMAKIISRSIDAPVLWFYIFDSDYLFFEFYKNGKKVAAYSPTDSAGCKRIYCIPALVGYEDGQKRRLSKILSCGDTEYQLELLEEYFGVCLIPLPDDPVAALSRVRSDQLYQAYLAEEKKLTGKQSPLKVELISAQVGKVFQHKFGDAEPHLYRPSCFYFGYDSLASNFEGGNLRPVRFAQGKLIPITQEEFDIAPKIPYANDNADDRITEEFYPVYKIFFTDKAPDGLKHQCLAPPRGFYFFDFDEHGRVILSNERGSIMVVDETLKVIAKLHVKGEPVAYADGYILTAGSESFFAFYYNPSNKIRIYRLSDN